MAEKSLRAAPVRKLHLTAPVVTETFKDNLILLSILGSADEGGAIFSFSDELSYMDFLASLPKRTPWVAPLTTWQRVLRFLRIA